MQLTNAIKQRIKNLSKNKKLSMHKLSLKAGIAYSTLNSFFNSNDRGITITTLLHICEGLEISLADFFSDKLFDEVEDND